CDADEVCTNSDNICEPKDQLSSDITSVCGTGSGACQTCSATDKYTCVSSTQGARCVNGQLSTLLIFECGDDEICVTDAVEPFDTPCVPQCVADFANWNSSCSNAVYTPPTLSPPTTPSPSDIQSICTQAAASKSTRYFYAYADATCRSYVYCQRRTTTTTIFDTTFAGSCSSPTPYFNTANGACQATVPASCLEEAPTTVASSTTSTTTTDQSTAASSQVTDSTPASDGTVAPTVASTASSDAPTASSDAPTASSDAPTASSDAPTASSDASTATSDPTTASP
ncbi:hypothetical protein KR222_003755, partial [Zaprionus bogoriensis]